MLRAKQLRPTNNRKRPSLSSLFPANTTDIPCEARDVGGQLRAVVNLCRRGGWHIPSTDTARKMTH